uniref:Disease resistance protein RGA3 n=1 Tax=Manihot esculenta TaxID=3983 RepID=A0A2C9V0Z5_MANES
MADMVASPLLWMLSDRLISLIDNSSLVKNLHLTLAEIQTLVLDAENRSEDDAALRRWLTEVKDAAYEADDVLDEFINSLSSSKIHSLFSPFQWLLRFNCQRKMKEIEGRLDALLKRRIQFQKAVPLVNWDGFQSFESSASIKVPHRETRSFISESEIFGRKEDKQILLDLLLGDSDVEFKIIPIVGMGGLGKTTLAQLIFNDERIHYLFERRYWVCVSQNFDVRMIGKALVETKTEASRFLMNTEETVDSIVREELNGRRFFIVLDDVWNEDQEKWNVLQRWFSVGARGSAVLVTTRSANVAALMGTVDPYRLKLLSDDDVWLLFKNVAFSSKGEENINSRLVEIGKRLVARCKGLPLAIKTLAGLMRFKGEESEWLQIKDDDIWNLREFESSVLPALRLSYNHLPSHLKQCFAYCSIFPQGVTIGKEQLIQLWVAEGFIQSIEGSRSLEDIGNDYFMELFRRSFFVEIWRDEYGEIVKCQMHYLIHDLARFVASIGCSIMEGNTLQNVPEEVRHSSLVYDSYQLPTTLESLQKAKKLRTLLLFSNNLEKIPGLFLKLRSLRALDLSGSQIQKLSRSVGNLTHLRYLNLSCTRIETLPNSISKLQSLNTLELIECYNLQELPNSISELIKLRHLDIQSCCSLSHMPARIGKLRLLQKLPLFILSDIDGCGSISELSELDLRGKLEIKNLEFVDNPTDAENAKLLNKQNLRTLKLSWSHDAVASAEMSFQVLEKLMPPQELKVLHIIDYKGTSYPSWLINSLLQNVAEVSLVNCSCKKLPPFGQLPNLKYLYIKGMLKVEKIDNEFYGDGTIKAFPSLRQLELYDMPYLKEWWNLKSDEQSKEFTCLEYLTIKGCSNLSRLPELPNLKNLALWNCNEELLLSLDQLASLSTLVINEFRKPLSIPAGNLTSLRKMTIYDCDDLLAQLVDDMKPLSSLEHLRILYCDALKSLPTGLRYLTSLQKLEIAECRELVEVPDVMDKLSSLKELTIDGCPMLKSLPDSIRYLSRLEKLVIGRCPELIKQLHIEESDEWSKTAHIPRIEKEIEEYLTEEDSLSEPSY